MQEKQFKDAIAVLQLNLEEHDDFWLIYDILGQAYMGDGNKNLAIENFTKSLELNPENANAAEMLKKLK